MKKIYIITFHRAISYGAFLQAYALQNCSILKAFNPEIIDYYPERFHYKNFLLSSSGNVLKRVIKFIPAFLPKTKLFLTSKKFAKKYLFLTKKTLVNYKDFDDALFDEDAIYISGSDQIWDIRYDNNIESTLPYYLSFTSSKKIAYSSSCGEMKYYDNRTKSEYKEILSLLEKYSALSVREQFHAEDLNKCNPNLNVQMMIDPTFLLSKNEWEQRLNPKRVFKEKYILVYGLYKNSMLHDYAKKIAKKYNFKIVSINDLMDFHVGEKNIFNCTPFKLLEYIRDSECIVTDSFHGCALSLNFNKQIYIFIPNSSSERVINLVSIFGLTNRVVNNNEDIDEYMDYSIINERLNHLRSDAYSFLFSSINEEGELDENSL